MILTAAQLFGSTPTRASIETAEAALAELGGAWVRSALLLNLAASQGMAGALDEARANFDETLALAEQFGATFGIAAAHEFLGGIELSAGDAEAAEREYRAHVEIMGRLGNEGHRSTGAAYLAIALCRQGRFEEAEGFVRMARELGADDDLATQVTARMALARIRSAAGAHEEAMALARESLDLYADAQSPNGQGDLRLDHATVLAEAGLPQEAASALREALGFFELKGNLLGAAGARAALERLGA